MTTFHNAPAENNDASPIEKQPAVKDQLAGLREAVVEPQKYVALLIESLTEKLRSMQDVEPKDAHDEEVLVAERAIAERRLEIAQSMA